jgi:hypothetical protein
MPEMAQTLETKAKSLGLCKKVTLHEAMEGKPTEAKGKGKVAIGKLCLG